MTIRTPRFGGALLATIALVACTKPSEKPVTDSAANATLTVVAPTDSAATQPKADSTKLATDSTKPAVRK